MKDHLQAVRVRIGTKVRELRLLRGLTQEQLAELVGNQYKHIGQVERGEVNVSIDILTNIARTLAVDVFELLRPAAGSRGTQRTYTLGEAEIEQIERALASSTQALDASTRTLRMLARIKQSRRPRRTRE